MIGSRGQFDKAMLQSAIQNAKNKQAKRKRVTKVVTSVNILAQAMRSALCKQITRWIDSGEL